MRDVLRSPFLWAFAVGCVLVTMMRPMLRFEPAPPPVLGTLPEFSLVDAQGEPFGSEDLRGSVWVANFFFTRCTTVCPAVMASVARLSERYREDGVEGIRLVSISVDPDHDTPERLREKAPALGADLRRWVLLTGPADAIRSLSQKGFELAAGEPETTPEGIMDVVHSGKLVLVDGSGNVRGYYGSDPEGLDEVFHRSLRVLREARERAGAPPAAGRG